MKCAGCMKFVKEASTVKCTSATCDKNFCVQCVSVPADRKKDWLCPECCASHKKGGDNSLTPVRGSSDYGTSRSKTDSIGNDSTNRKINCDSAGNDVNTNQVMDQLHVMTAQFATVMTKLDDVTKSLSFNNERLDELMLKWKATDERLKHLEKRDQEVEILQASVMQLQNELKTQVQQNLRNEIEICGIPEHVSENLHHTVLLAAKKTGIELEHNDIDWISRVGPRRPPVTVELPEDSVTKPRPIIVRLLRRTKRDQFMKAARARRNINSADLGVQGAPQRVYFNERLTKENRLLFREARSRAKQHGYTFCWCSQGTIYIRQREGKSAIPIQSYKDLDRLLPPLTTIGN